MKFAFPFINDTLGHSIIYEEYKGDLTKARQLAEENLQSARRVNDLKRLADILLFRGIVYLLQGEPTTAISCFTEVKSISTADLPRQVRAALGTWGREKGSFSFTLGLGLLFSRVGRHWLFQKGDYERALVCYRLAEIVFRNLGAVSNEAQSLVDQGMTYKIIGEPNSAADVYEKARSLYNKVSSAKPELMTEIRWRLAHLEQEIYFIYEQHRNTDGMARSLERLKVQLEQPLPRRDMENIFNVGLFIYIG
ncbi:MAG: hypothetical protein SAK29_24595 [Scytonema sp. PMC 1069.18]|nr:hypothetical protein [Scytonema sp. PMC 1069.18]MEC4882750.1 hypothetical protein [Scytonema sp. PMC 1070.18]